MLNRKRFWFFTVVLALVFVLGAATLSAVFAGPPTRTAQDGLAQEQGRATREPEEPRGADERRRLPTAAAEEPRSGPERDAPPGSDAGSAGRAGPAGELAGAGPVSPASPYPVSGGPPTGGDGDAAPGTGGGPATGPGGDADNPERPDGDGDVYYNNCNQVRRAGAAPLYRGEPGYRAKLDRDGDGTACD
jgi:hypothetical protein